ncbi:MAG: hypothetical protein J6W64_10930, partial [Bacilli bacterium]|nr:hypothetical protein [Bacilli bacterium]
MKNALIFLGGAAVGGLAATLYFKRKMVVLEEDYQRITNDEINNYIKEFHSSCDEEKQNIDDIPLKHYITGIDIGNDEDEYAEIVKEYNGQEEEEEEQIAPYIITP